MSKGPLHAGRKAYRSFVSRIFVTGGSGALGRAIIPCLA